MWDRNVKFPGESVYARAIDKGGSADEEGARLSLERGSASGRRAFSVWLHLPFARPRKVAVAYGLDFSLARTSCRGNQRAGVLEALQMEEKRIGNRSLFDQVFHRPIQLREGS